MMRISFIWLYALVTIIALGLVTLASGSEDTERQARLDRVPNAGSLASSVTDRSGLALGDKAQRRSGVTAAIGSSDGLSEESPDPTGQVATSYCLQPAENCQERDTSVALTSDRTKYFVAEDFIPADNGSVTEVCLKGGYWDYGTETDCRDQATDSFRIRYLADNGGVPGAELFVFEQPSTLTLVGPLPTGDLIASKPREFEHIATHEPVPLVAGQCYWIEITNKLTLTEPGSECVWMWEGAVASDEWAVQDDEGDGVYAADDAIPQDLAFCLDVALDNPGACVPPPPPNDDCGNAQPIWGEGTFSFNNMTATTDGLAHDACNFWGEDQIEADIWYCWQSPCTGTILVTTCDETEVDTRIAVYDGCDVCPGTDAEILACNDDRCGDMVDPRQSMAVFEAQELQTYMIRLGVYPGERRGMGTFTVSCGPPDNPACPGDGDCCGDTSTPACNDETCCEMVCACDPFCCTTVWDENCSTTGWQGSTCGAAVLCSDLCEGCGNPDAGDCCVDNGTASCSDLECCQAVCDADSFCCEVAWDDNCATDGYLHNGNGAWDLCPTLCSTCPVMDLTWADPPNGVVDARQPHPPDNAETLQGIDTITLTGGLVDGLDPHPTLDCWTLCETGDRELGVNDITSVEAVVDENGLGTWTVTLARPITPGEITTVTYTDHAGAATAGMFIAHPANVDGDTQSSPSDILRLIDYINGAGTSPWGLYSEDIDHSGLLGPPDILRTIDLLNGAGQFDSWLNVGLPTGSTCP